MAAAASDGTRNLREIAQVLSDDLHRRVSVDNVRFIVDEKLRPLGVLETETGDAPELAPQDPFLALKFRQAVIPPNVVNAVAKLFKPLFFPLVVGAVLAWVGVLDVWLFFHHGVASGVRELLYQPALLVALLGLLALSALFHECGHAAACRYGGATPGAMGVGLYIVWPAFYTDVTDAYRLNRVGRLRTDLGGVYFNLVFILAVAGVYFWTGFEPLLALIALQHLEILHQFIPWIRLDGYYVVSDITGVPDVMSRVKPTLLSLIPGRRTDPRVSQLKPWVRTLVTVYVLTVVPILIAFTALMVIATPHVLATAVASAKLEAARLSTALAHRAVMDGVVAAVQVIALSLPPLGLVLTLLKLARTAMTHVGRQPVLRAATVFGGVAAAAMFGFNAWANHPFKPIARGDRGTLQAAAGALVRPHPRPAETPARVHRRPAATTSTSGATTTSGEQTPATMDGSSSESASVPASTSGPAETRPFSSSTPETSPAETTPVVTEPTMTEPPSTTAQPTTTEITTTTP